MSTEYKKFLDNKKYKYVNVGIDIGENQIHPMLFDFQKLIVKWALKKGRAAIFLDTGLGKTFLQLEWARILNKKTIIIAPLSVAMQTINEGKKINIDIKYIRSMEEIDNRNIFISNYEMIDKIDFNKFESIILDESSILKSISGKIKTKLIKKTKDIKYKLACTATPAPNDFIEIGNHAEFLGICTKAEMLAMFFINANKEHMITDGKFIYRKKGMNKHGTEWRLKHHAEYSFFEWLSSWAIAMIKPSDLGFENRDFDLPNLNIEKVIIDIEYKRENELFFTGLKGISDRNKIRDDTRGNKFEIVKNILKEIKNKNEQCIVWCDLNNEQKFLEKNLLLDYVSITGSDSTENKIEKFNIFLDNKKSMLIIKPKIGGFGMNFQNANNMIFYGLSDSWERFYQCIRREYRYGQKKQVNVWIVITNVELGIYKNIMRKDRIANFMRNKLIEQIKKYEEKELFDKNYERQEYKVDKYETNNYIIINGDSCEELKNMKDENIHLSIYSPPFADLYTYSNTERDLGNSKTNEEFFNHYNFIIKELLRITKQGRLSCVHCMDIPALAQKDGYIGIKDFPGDIIREHINAGWIFYGRCYIQKNPQAQAIRTHSKALLFVQMKKDSACSRPALIDQILIFQKPGNNNIPIEPVKNGELDNEKWIEWAHGIWTGISESDILKYIKARDEKDEKHICPLQLGTIERCIKLYSNPGETILTPFMGIGSEVYQALRFNRKGIGIELKDSYFRIAKQNIEYINNKKNEGNLFE